MTSERPRVVRDTLFEKYTEPTPTTTKKKTKKEKIEELERTLDKIDKDEAEEFSNAAVESLVKPESKSTALTSDEKKQLEQNGMPSISQASRLTSWDAAHFLCSHCRIKPRIASGTCSKCREAWYCSIECQKSAFPSHRAYCDNYKKENELREQMWNDWLSEVPERAWQIMYNFVHNQIEVPVNEKLGQPILSDRRDLIPFINAQSVDVRFAQAPRDNPHVVEKFKKMIVFDEPRSLAQVAIPLSISRRFHNRNKDKSFFAILHRNGRDAMMEFSVDHFPEDFMVIPKKCKCTGWCTARSKPKNPIKQHKYVKHSSSDLCAVCYQPKTLPNHISEKPKRDQVSDSTSNPSLKSIDLPD